MYLVNRIPLFPSQFWHLPHSSQTTALKLYAIHYRHWYNGHSRQKQTYPVTCYIQDILLCL